MVALGVLEVDEVPVLVSIDCLRFDYLAISKLFFLFAPLLAPLPLFVPLALDGRLLTAETVALLAYPFSVTATDEPAEGSCFLSASI